MITKTVEVAGKDYLLCASLRVVRYMNHVRAKAISEEDSVDELVDMLKIMIDAGDKYAKTNGIDNPEPLSKDDILDYLGMDDYMRIQDAINAATLESSKRTLEVEPPKDSKKNGAPETALES